MAAGSLNGRRVAIYARFSSEKQSETSIDDQVRRCRAFVEREGGSVAPSYVFTDYATSGASLARSGFEAMMSLTKLTPPAVDVIVAEDLSRVTRDLADGAMLFRRLQFLGVKLIGVADGVDTSAKHAKLTYTVKNLVADIYLDDLRDKTLRGLEGRHHANLSTGNPPYGYRSVAAGAPDNEHAGRRIEVDEEKAAIVRRVFDLYLEGRSLNVIARMLHSEGVSPPRANTKHRRKGWVDATIRVFLHNEKYAGIWRYKERQWVKVPGENRRIPRKRESSEVLEQIRPDLRIIDARTWREVQIRLAATKARFTRNSDGTPKGRAVLGRQTNYLLSGLLFCGVCGAPMIIHGGTTSPVYRCPDYSKRRTCKNDLPVKERIARLRILEALHDNLFSADGLAYSRKQIAERLGNWARERNAVLTEHRQRLARTEARIAGLIQFVSEGDHSAYVRSTLLDLEAQAKTEKGEIAAIERDAASVIHLPSPEELEQLAHDIEARIAQDPLAGREILRRLLKDGRIVLEPQLDRVYLARCEAFPAMLLATPGRLGPLWAPQNENRRLGLLPEAAMSTQSSGGVI
jgi:DNA invertase Pin-like site-specific DNA recombinase